MTSFPMEIGRVVYSKAGRDAGSHYVVVDIVDADHVAIANGCLRKVDNPKKKKIKHLTARPECIESVQVKLQEGKIVFDSELRNYLEAAGYADTLPPRKEG